MQQYEILSEKAGFFKKILVHVDIQGLPRTRVDFLLTIQVQNFQKNILEKKEMDFKKWVEKYKQRIITAGVQ